MPKKPSLDAEMRRLNEETLCNHSLLTEISSGIRWLRDDITVNGSRGLENVLRDNYDRTEANAQAIGELKDLTHNLRVARQVRLAREAWVSAHPRVAGLFNSAAKKTLWVLVVVVASYFGIQLS